MKPLDDFHKHPNAKDGHINKCKVCARLEARINRAKNYDHYHTYDQNRPTDVQWHSRQKKKYMEKYPERYKAQYMVRNAIKAGRISKSVCWVCGEQAEAHHPDYSQPLSVVWLCKRHHEEVHLLVDD